MFMVTLVELDPCARTWVAESSWMIEEGYSRGAALEFTLRLACFRPDLYTVGELRETRFRLLLVCCFGRF